MTTLGSGIVEVARAAIEGIANGLWQGAILVAAVAIFVRVVRGGGAALRHLIWLAALITVVALMITSTVSGLPRTASATGAANIIVVAEVAGPASSAFPTSAVFSVDEDNPLPRTRGLALNVRGEWLVILVMLFAFGAAVKLARMVEGLSRWRSIRRRAQRYPIDLQDIVDDLPPAFLRRTVSMRISDEVTLPVTAGLLHPTILLPRSLSLSIARMELRQIVLHELAHIRRWDDWSNLVQRLFESVFFFNPLVGWIGRRLEVEREIACDEHVVANLGAGSAYAAFLIELAETITPMSERKFVAGVAANKNQLSRRVEAILTGGAKMNRWQFSLAMGGAAAVLSMSLLMASAGPGLTIAVAAEVGPTYEDLNSRELPSPIDEGPIAVDSERTAEVVTESSAVMALHAGSTESIAADEAEELQAVVSGRVASVELAPLSGVLVTLEGSNVGAVTNSSGQYSIDVPSPGTARLVFSAPGFASQIVSVDGRRVVNVMLEPQTEVQRHFVSGRVTTPELEPLSGVTITPEGSTTGVITDANGYYRIGLVSIGERLLYSRPGYGTRAIRTDEGEPVIDVVMQSQAEVAARSDALRDVPDVLYVINGVLSTAADFERLDPADIERISTLANPSAAVYGERARNGVVLVNARTR